MVEIISTGQPKPARTPYTLKSGCLGFPLSIARPKSTQWGFRLSDWRGRRKRLRKEAGLRLGKCYYNLKSKSTNSSYSSTLESCHFHGASGPAPDPDSDHIGCPWDGGECWGPGERGPTRGHTGSRPRLVLIPTSASQPVAPTVLLINPLLHSLSCSPE